MYERLNKNGEEIGVSFSEFNSKYGEGTEARAVELGKYNAFVIEMIQIIGIKAAEEYTFEILGIREEPKFSKFAQELLNECKKVFYHDVIGIQPYILVDKKIAPIQITFVNEKPKIEYF